MTPELDKVAVIGHSAGAGMSVQVAAAAAANGFPVPDAIMSVQPGSDVNPTDERDILAVPPSVLLLIVQSDKDQFARTRQGLQIYNRATQIASEQRAYVFLHSPETGAADAIADHYSPLSPLAAYQLETPSLRQRLRERIVKSVLKIPEGRIDKVDTIALWPLSDALLTEAFRGGRSMRRVLLAAGVTGVPDSDTEPLMVEWPFAGP